jgi:hypothetical protein
MRGGLAVAASSRRKRTEPLVEVGEGARLVPEAQSESRTEGQLMGYARKVDANQAEIVAALRKAGYLVKDLRKAGDGAPDLLVAGGWTVMGAPMPVKLLEVKRAKGKLTQAQSAWREQGWPVIVVRTVSEALSACDGRGEVGHD